MWDRQEEHAADLEPQELVVGRKRQDGELARSLSASAGASSTAAKRPATAPGDGSRGRARSCAACALVRRVS